MMKKDRGTIHDFTLDIESPIPISSAMGAIISDEQFQRTTSYMEVAKQSGARILFGGKRPIQKRY